MTAKVGGGGGTAGFCDRGTDGAAPGTDCEDLGGGGFIMG